MNQSQGWVQRQRTGLWHLRHGGLKGFREWQQRQGPVTLPREHYGRQPAPTVTGDLNRPVIAGMATMPSRIPVLKDAFHSIYWQVDRVYVYLNGFDAVPDFLKKPNVTIFRSQDFRDYKDVGKFFALTEVKEGILFTVDDDILYPPDYVSKMLSYLASTGFKAAVGVHGFHLPTLPKSFFDRRMFHFRRGLDSPALVSVLGTGTTAFDIAQTGIEFEDFTSYGMADIHLAAYLKKKNLVALALPRESGWLLPLGTDEDASEGGSLYEQTQRDAAPHGRVLRASAPWGEAYVLSAWKALKDDSILEEPLVRALEAISESRVGDQENFVEKIFKLEPRDSKSTLDWIDIYAEQSTKVKIFERLLDSNPTRSLMRDILNRMWKTDVTATIETSAQLVKESPNDFQLLRQHAHYSAGYFRPEDAKRYYLRSVQLAGAQGYKGTPSILYDYFKFLVRFRDFQTATAVASSLKSTHSRVPFFQSCMVLCALSVSDDVGATSWLSSLMNSADSTQRRGAIVSLVRFLAEYPLRLASPQQSIISPETVDHCKTEVDELEALLKIATVCGDGEGAKKVFIEISRNHPQFLVDHKELEAYYKSNWLRDPALSGQSFTGHRKVLEMARHHDEFANSPLVSIVLTAYNSEETVGFAIESILNQTHRNLELIVVDDKSNDGTVRVIEEYLQIDPRVSLISNKTNLGPYTSRNVALKRANGSFVAIQDSDDVSLPERLSRQLDCFSAETKAVLGQHLRIDSVGAIHLENDGSILGHGPVTLMVRREVFNEIGHFSSVRTRGDKEFESRLEHFFGSHALLRTDNLWVYALQDDASNSRVQTATLDKKRKLMLFKQSYTSKHLSGDFSPVTISSNNH